MANLFSRLLGKPDVQAQLRNLWHRIVAIAREPHWYRSGGIADTVTGRFDAITLVLCAVLLRMERDEELRQRTARLTELFVADMDGQLRESGIGDVVVGKHVGKLVSMLGGRLGAYRAALNDGSDAELVAAVTRNVTLHDNPDPAHIARQFRELTRQLGLLDPQQLLAADFIR